MHGLQTIIKNNQDTVTKQLSDAEKANQGKLFPTNQSINEALNAVKRKNG